MAPTPPDPEVKPKTTRRTFTAQQKLKILKEADELEPGIICPPGQSGRVT